MKILITAGGSGGHIIPAECLYKFLKNKEICHWSVDTRGLKYTSEKPQYCWNSHGKNIFLRIFKIFIYFFKSLWILRKYDTLISFGTYHSIPFLISAVILRKKIYLHEQNTQLSRVNKIFGMFGKVIGAWPTLESTIFHGGMPLRPYEPNPSKDFKILIIFGSQEAPFLKPMLYKIFKNIPKEIQKKITILADPNNFQIIDGLHFKTQEFKTNFKENILSLYDGCSMAIGRGGAGFIYEMLFLKKPFITIPIKKSVGNHQYFNAQYGVNTGLGCLIMEDEDISQGTHFIIQAFNKKIPIKDHYVIDNASQKIYDFINN
jgi:UDP-N-acetylglucosamine--N-acetylmuramyl-(pentapeptide) pyrophosphoryl-undecaprenol N-acetylglucosamine transferase